MSEKVENTDNSNEKKSALHKRLFKAFGAETFGNVVILLIQICSVPLFLSFWGELLYGEWLLLSTIPGYFAMSDLGFASAAGTVMTMKVAKGDRDGALGVFQSAWVLITGVSVFITLTAILLSFFLPVKSWLHLNIISESQVHIIVPLLIMQVFFVLQRQLIALGYRCDGNYAVGSLANSIKRLFDFAVLVGVLFSRGNPVTLMSVLIITDVISTIIYLIDVRRRSPWLKTGTKHADTKVMRSLLTPAIAFMGFPLGHALNLQGMISVIGLVLGPKAIVLFTTTRTLTRSIAQLLGSVNNTIWVELSTAFGAGSISLARQLHRRSCQAAFWTAIVLSVALCIVAKPLFEHWTKGKVDFNPVLTLLLLLVITLNSLWSASHIVPMASNAHQRISGTYIVATGVGLAVAAGLCHIVGIYGAALALMTIDITMISFVIPLSLRMVDDSLLVFVQSVLRPELPALTSLLPKLVSKLNVSK